MKLINSKYEILEQNEGVNGIYQQIELAGRTCYKSEDKITEDSAKDFVDRMIHSGHGAMLEHGTVYLTIENYEDIDEIKYKSNKHSKAVTVFPNILYVTTNLRVLVENNWLGDIRYICEPTKYHEKRVTVKFICDRGVSHEFVRHRVFSFAQESTRYCNYSKDKFNNECTFIIPSWCTYPEGCYLPTNSLQYGSYIWSLRQSEEAYFELLHNGWIAQQARAVLPNALKTELVMTGTVEQWKGFFELRDNSKAHPDAQALAKPLHEEFIKKGYIDGNLD